MNEQVYKKKGRKYVPIGYSDGFTGFPSDGIWLVHTKDGSKSSECVIKYEDLEHAKPAINLILGYKDKIVKFLMENPMNNISVNYYALNMLKEISK